MEPEAELLDPVYGKSYRPTGSSSDDDHLLPQAAPIHQYKTVHPTLTF